jgi:hypothetical protein
MTVKKSIKRRSKISAQRAMLVHIKKMKARGWKVGQEYEGESFLSYECITYFYR